MMSNYDSGFGKLISISLIMRSLLRPMVRLRNFMILFIFSTCLIGATQGVPCFCTENRCTYGYCESPWCLVGIQHNGRVIRTCGSETSQQLQPCLHDIGDWQDVCACTTPYCNTFAFLRYEIRAQAVTVRPSGSTPPIKPLRPAARPQPAVVHFDRMTTDETTDPSNLAANARRSRKKGHKDDIVVFERNDEKEAVSLRQSYLIIVLIVVPLSIAGTAVIVVIVGYYCKMC